MLGKIVDLLKAFVKAHLTKLLATFGVLLICVSFCDLRLARDWWSFAFVSRPRLEMYASGWILIALAVAIFWWTRRMPRVDRSAKLGAGIRLPFAGVEVVIKTGRIEQLCDLDNRTAVVLPANTTFVDDCLIDKKSALGSYVLEHFTSQLDSLRTAIQKLLPSSTGDIGGQPAWSPGTTILLGAPFDHPARVLVTAATVRIPGSSITAEPASVLACIRSIFEKTGYQKIDQIRMPLIGSGYGGLTPWSALLFILLGLRHYAKTFHHIKQIEIVVLDRDAAKFRDVYRVQYVMSLEESREGKP